MASPFSEASASAGKAARAGGPSSRAPAPRFDPPTPADVQRLNGAYRELLRAFADGAAPGAVAEIVDKQACVLDGVSLEFRFNALTRLVAVHADVGCPQPWQALETAQRALELQWLQPTPAIWLLGRHPASGHYVLLTHHVVSERTRDDAASLLQQARTCALFATTLRRYFFG